MKFSVFFFMALFFSLNGFGQYRSGEVTYKVRGPKELTQFVDTSGIQNEHVKKLLVQTFYTMRKGTPFLRYDLKFNNAEAKMTRAQTMKVDNGMNLELIPAVPNSTNIFYSNSIEKANYHFMKSFGKWLIKTSMDSIPWKITKEKKVIQGYTCQKAVAEVNRDGVYQGEIVAWFAPEIPFQFGPMNYNGLPGLVLEMIESRFKMTFYADKIKLSKKSIQIDKPTEGKLIHSYKEYLDYARKHNPLDRGATK